MKKINQKGFTLIELMITVSLIVILSAVVLQVVNPNTLRAKTRDKQRIADLKRIQTALELYYADHRSYPSLSWLVINGSDDDLTMSLTSYMDDIPTDPLYAGSSSNSGPCSNGTTNRRYNYTSDGANYVITAQMELSSSADESPCVSASYWDSGSMCTSGFDNNDICYGVSAP